MISSQNYEHYQFYQPTHTTCYDKLPNHRPQNILWFYISYQFCVYISYIVCVVVFIFHRDFCFTTTYRTFNRQIIHDSFIILYNCQGGERFQFFRSEGHHENKLAQGHFLHLKIGLLSNLRPKLRMQSRSVGLKLTQG